MDYRSPLSKARGLGSAKTGTGHWWLQRVTAVALIPLTFWLLQLLDLSMNATYQTTVDWLAAPVNTVGVVAWILAVFYHAALGIQVVIEDYVSAEGARIVSIFLLLTLTALIAVFRIVLAG